MVSVSIAATRSTGSASWWQNSTRGLQPGDAHRLLQGWGGPRSEPGSGSERPTTVLLAERDPFAADLSGYLLRTEGYATRVVLTVEAARQVLHDEPPILAVVDLLISGGGGLELCRLTKARGSVAVVAVSALDSRDQALEAGADAFLRKPLDPLQLLSTVRDLLGISARLRRSVGGAMNERLPSGSSRLDAVLGEVSLVTVSNLVIGPPGTGKTILAQQYLLSTTPPSSDPLCISPRCRSRLEKILRYGQGLDFFDKSAVGSTVIYEDLGQRLNADGLSGGLDQLTGLLRDRRPALLVIDSFKALRAYASDDGAFRRFLHELAGQLSAMAVTAFWVGEYDATQTADLPEFAVADAILSLGVENSAERETRLLRVLKLRGSSFRSGRHAYRLSAEGLGVFPRLADPVEGAPYEAPPERTTSGVAALDEMLSDGYWRGASTLIAGPSGSGKTLLALHFAFSGAALGEPCVFATFQENPTQLERVAAGFAWSLKDPLVELMYWPSVDLYLDEWVYDLLDRIERTGATRVAIDSLGDLRAVCGDELRFREYIYSLLQRCARCHTSVMMTQEVSELFGVTRLSEYGISHLSDNVVLLQFLRGDSEVKRAISVLKTRGSAHDPRIRQFEITPAGLVLGD